MRIEINSEYIDQGGRVVRIEKELELFEEKFFLGVLVHENSYMIYDSEGTPFFKRTFLCKENYALNHGDIKC